MKIQLALLASLFALVLAGCSRDSGGPEPLPTDKIASEFHKAFNRASPPVKELSDRIVAAVGAKNYPEAHQSIQMLAAMDELTEEQRSLVNRAMPTIFTHLQEAEAKGDATAGAALNAYRSGK